MIVGRNAFAYTQGFQAGKACKSDEHRAELRAAVIKAQASKDEATRNYCAGALDALD